MSYIKQMKANAVSHVLDDPENRVLLHVCNNKSTMGSGIAREVRERMPGAYEAYLACEQELGKTSTNESTTVYNMIAQDSYNGYKGVYEKRKYLSYKALVECLTAAVSDLKYSKPDAEIVIPYRMGADRAGGEWERVLGLVTGLFPNNNITICEL